MRHRRTTVALLAAAAVTSLLVPVGPATAAGNTLVVDVASPVRPVTHVGSGGLYALATTSTPDPALLKPLRLNQLTQPAPGVQQLGNGATVPTGDALVVAPSAIGAGAQTYVRMPDIYRDFPYRWVSWADWESKVRTMVNARVGAAQVTNINGWELWNEPDWTWSTGSAGSFTSGWARTFKLVRSLDAVTPIVGPSYSVYNHSWMLSFLTAAKASNTVPDVIVWHELDDFGWANIDEHVADYRAIEASLGISPRPISINEYGSPNQVDTPSVAAHYLAQFERTGIKDAERAYWYESGTIGGLFHNNRPTGSYWAYKWYGDMAGNIVRTTPSGDLDGVAAYDSSRKIVNVVLGGTYGTNSVQVRGLSGFGSSVRVTVSHTPASGRYANVTAPTQVSSSNYTVSNGAITVPIVDQDYLGAYQVLVTPASGPTSSWQKVYEAENATVVNANRFATGNASNGSYVGQIDGTGSSRADSFVDFIVQVPSTRAYTMSIRYANGTGATSTHGLAYNGGGWSTVSYPPTAGWAQFASTTVSVNLNAGYNVIRLAKGSPNFTGGVGYAELDSITLN
ncbi:hypothetical protein KIN34_07345 [Cellulomonas sp. DKR-3]|uniref:CBM6 domain-containing protein n=1 Tax=Cellulomonas fulva TaxID=2835530 RepID=A0ABS5TY67_9CELL|nr:hypothetical protein [Cellulomonas fulva]MBT0994097.1 hypothetical protein [Cellulomonas fulva]